MTTNGLLSLGSLAAGLLSTFLCWWAMSLGDYGLAVVDAAIGFFNLYLLWWRNWMGILW